MTIQWMTWGYSLALCRRRKEAEMHMTSGAARRATTYRMVTAEHTCPYGLQAKDLLRREGYAV